jgi:hypothetical protein
MYIYFALLNFITLNPCNVVVCLGYSEGKIFCFHVLFFQAIEFLFYETILYNTSEV